MSSYHFPPVISIPNLTTIERAAVLDALFEPCTALHTLSVDLLHTQPFELYDELITAVGKQLEELSESISSSDKQWLDRILGAHPRLGARKIESEQSRGEQAQLHTSREEEAEALRSLNDEYEKTFPGLIYVVFVNGRGRGEIMENMRSRIARRDIMQERQEAVKAMVDIARDRATKLQTS